jgi:hypothetical protein
VTLRLQRCLARLERARTAPSQPPDSVNRAAPLPFRLKNAADVLALVEEQVQAVRADAEASALEKARVVGYLAGVSLKAIEAGNLAARIEMLEAVLKQRDKGASQ